MTEFSAVWAYIPIGEAAKDHRLCYLNQIFAQFAGVAHLPQAGKGFDKAALAGLVLGRTVAAGLFKGYQRHFS